MQQYLRATFLILVSACGGTSCLSVSTWSNLDLGGSAVQLSPVSVPADGATAATVRIVLRRADGAPVSGVTALVQGQSLEIAQTDTVSDANGLVTAIVRSTVPGSHAVAVQVGIEGYETMLSQKATALFYQVNLDTGTVDSVTTTGTTTGGTTTPGGTDSGSGTSTASTTGGSTAGTTDTTSTTGTTTTTTTGTTTTTTTSAGTTTGTTTSTTTTGGTTSGTTTGTTTTGGTTSGTTTTGGTTSGTTTTGGTTSGTTGVTANCTPLGSSLFISNTPTSKRSTAPSLALDANNAPLVAWADNRSGIAQVYVLNYTGGAWQALGNSTQSGGIGNNANNAEAPSIMADSGGNVVVAWADDTGNTLFSKQFKGGTWQSLYNGGSGATIPNGGVTPIAVAIAGNGAGTYEVMTAAGTGDVYSIAAGYTSTAWSLTNIDGGSVAVTGLAARTLGGPSVAVGGGNTYTAYSDLHQGSGFSFSWQVYVTAGPRATSTTGLAGSASGTGLSQSSGAAQDAVVVLDSSNRPIVAWDDDSSGSPQIYLKRYNGTAWVAMGGSASGTGISNSSGDATMPNLALDPSGNPVLVWLDDSAGVPELYSQRWNGSAWVDTTTGATSGFGVSNNQAAGVGVPRIAVQNDGTLIIVWEDHSALGYRIAACSLP